MITLNKSERIPMQYYDLNNASKHEVTWKIDNLYHSKSTINNIWVDYSKWGYAKLANTYYLINETKRSTRQVAGETISRTLTDIKYRPCGFYSIEEIEDRGEIVRSTFARADDRRVFHYLPSWKRGRHLYLICYYDLMVIKLRELQ